MLRDFKISQEEDSVVWRGGFKAPLESNMLITCWLLPIPSPSRLNAFGWTRSQQKLSFLLGKLRGGRSSHWIGLKNEGDSFLIAVFCVVVKRKM